MSESGSNEIACTNCIAACCRAGAALVLSRSEVYRNRRAMSLKRIYKERDYPQQVPFPAERYTSTGARKQVDEVITLPAGGGLYVLEEDCGNLTEDGRCAVYDERPRACRNYEVGASACLSARASFGLDGHEAVQKIGQTVQVQIRRSPSSL